VYNNRLWVIGGATADGTNEVWDSANGVTWTRRLTDDATPPASQFKQRLHHAVAVLGTGAGARLWLVGGEFFDSDTGETTVFNDVWNSADGITWTKQVASAPFGPRTGHQLLSYNNKLWLLGGANLVDDQPVLYDDIWSSVDGINWVNESVVVSFFPRYRHAAAVFDGKMVVAVGWGQNALGQTGKLNDVWTSTNGVTWVRQIENAAFGRRLMPGLVAHSGRLWLLGGEGLDGGGNDLSLNDIWNSIDGKVWQSILAQDAGLPDQWSPRAYAGNVEFLGKLFVVGGWTDIGVANDVWSAP